MRFINACLVSQSPNDGIDIMKYTSGIFYSIYENTDINRASKTTPRGFRMCYVMVKIYKL